MGLTVAAQGIGWGMALALHTIRPTGGSNGVVEEVPDLSFMREMSLCLRLSQAKTWVTGKGPELGLCLEMKASCECPADLRLVGCTNYRGRVQHRWVNSALRLLMSRCK